MYKSKVSEEVSSGSQPSRKRRILVINDVNELDLDDDVKTEPGEECSVDEDGYTPNYSIKEEISEDITEKSVDAIKNNGTRDIPNFVVVENYDDTHLGRFRKIAPKDSIDLPVTDNESWRLSPPKKKRTITRKMKVKSVKSFKTKTDCKNSADEEKVYKSNNLFSIRLDSAHNVLEPIAKQQNKLLIQDSLKSKSKHGIELILCPYCHFKAPKEATIKKHIIYYHIELRKCPYCHYKSHYVGLMLKHIFKHEKGMKCPSCSMTFFKSSLYIGHLYSKHQESIFKHCLICGLYVGSYRIFKKQIEILHNHTRCHTKQ